MISQNIIKLKITIKFYARILYFPFLIHLVNNFNNYKKIDINSKYYIIL